MMPRIIFFGTPRFAIPCLDALAKKGFNVIGVVTQPDKPAGRGMKLQPCAVKIKAQELGINVFTEIQSPWRLDLQPLKPDLGVVVAYGKIIPKKILDAFPRGVLNIHPSLLPKYRGPSPVQTAILNGDKKTGVTIMLLDKEVDHGPILKNSKFQIPNSITGGKLITKLFQIGAELLVETLPKYLAGGIAPREQDHDKATFTKMLTREYGKIDWSKPAEYIERLVRAYDPWPGTWTMYQGKRLKILKASIATTNQFSVSRETENQLIFNCNPGALILEQVQPEGKKPMSGQEFLRGYSRLF